MSIFGNESAFFADFAVSPRDHCRRLAHSEKDAFPFRPIGTRSKVS